MKGLLVILVVIVVCVVFYWKAPHFPYQPSMSLHSHLDEKRLERLYTGDLLLFSSQCSKVLKYLFANQWTHVGLVYRDADSKLWIWESNLPIDPAQEKKGRRPRKSGPQLVDLKRKIRHYRGYVAVRHLVHDLERLSRAAINQRFSDCFRRYYHTAFETNYRRFVSIYIQHDPAQSKPSKKNAPAGIFCSELVASTLQDLGIMKKQRDPAYHWPHYFSNTSPSVHAIDRQLEEGFYYEPEVHLIKGSS